MDSPTSGQHSEKDIERFEVSALGQTVRLID